MAGVMRVLYVDDEPSLLDVCRIFLEKDGELSVDTTIAAKYALDILKHKKYEVIVSDYQMPGMDGIAFLKQFRTQYNETRLAQIMTDYDFTNAVKVVAGSMAT